MTITHIGSRRMQQALDRWGDAIKRDVKRIILETATIIQTNAQALAPADSGYLRQSIDVKLLDNGNAAMVTVGADYAINICRLRW